MIPEIQVLISVFISSILGSLHCVGMCGSLVALCCVSGTSTENKKVKILNELIYHLSRLISYLCLGYIAGSIGSLGSSYIDSPQFQKYFALIAGSVLILWGLRELGIFSFLKNTSSSFSNIQYSISSKILSFKLFKYPLQSSGYLRGAFVGLMSGLLPCGWLYAYVLIAASTQNPLSGVIIMGVFWLGTVPALIIFARILKKLNSIWLKRIPKITALIIILLGLMTISGRVSMIEESNSAKKSATMSCH